MCWIIYCLINETSAHSSWSNCSTAGSFGPGCFVFCYFCNMIYNVVWKIHLSNVFPYSNSAWTAVTWLGPSFGTNSSHVWCPLLFLVIVTWNFFKLLLRPHKCNWKSWKGHTDSLELAYMLFLDYHMQLDNSQKVSMDLWECIFIP